MTPVSAGDSAKSSLPYSLKRPESALLSPTPSRLDFFEIYRSPIFSKEICFIYFAGAATPSPSAFSSQQRSDSPHFRANKRLKNGILSQGPRVPQIDA